MKKIVLGTFLVVIVLMSGFFVKSFSTPLFATSSIEDALKNQWGIIGQVIHIEPIEDQVVVFSKKGSGSSYTLRSDFVRRNLFGWKWVWGGGFSGGCTGQYLEQVSDMYSPLLWGELRNNEIQKVKVNCVSKGSSYEAKIVSYLDTRVWFVFPKPNDKELNIEGISETDQIIDTQKIDLGKDLHPSILFGEKSKIEDKNKGVHRLTSRDL